MSPVRVVTRNISPAPSQSLVVMMGVCTWKNPRSWKNRCTAKEIRDRVRNTAPNKLVRARRWPMVRRNSTECPFFCSG